MAQSAASRPPPQRRWIACGLVATLVPPSILLAAMVAAGSNDSPANVGGLYLAMAVGLVAVWQCPLPLWAKIVVCAAYAPLMGFLLFGAAVSYACGVHGACL